MAFFENSRQSRGARGDSAVCLLFLNGLRMADILVLHGPNLNLLGTREPDVYGTEDLASINARLAEAAAVSGRSLDSFQSNSEVELIEKVHAARNEQIQAIIINPAGLTHTSVSLRDAIALPIMMPSAPV